jgi:hypothetical protein
VDVSAVASVFFESFLEEVADLVIETYVNECKAGSLATGRKESDWKVLLQKNQAPRTCYRIRKNSGGRIEVLYSDQDGSHMPVSFFGPTNATRGSVCDLTDSAPRLLYQYARDKDDGDRLLVGLAYSGIANLEAPANLQRVAADSKDGDLVFEVCLRLRE